MLEVRLKQALILKKIIDALKELVTEVNLDCSEDGISLQAMDSSHVALVTFLLRAQDFLEFRCSHQQSLGLSIGNLAKILHCADNEDSVVIRAGDNSSVVTFVFEGVTDDKVSEFRLNLMMLDSEKLGIPDQQFSAIATIPSGQFTRICREMSQLADTMVIELTKTHITFHVEGDIGGGTIVLKHNEGGRERTFLEVTEPVSASFALRYLNLFNKAASLSESAVVMMSAEMPLVLQYSFEIGQIKYFLAPKISED
jgi:proliferating cell nuclear antigen